MKSQKSTAKSYADKAIAKGNNKGIFVFTGDVSKGCIALAQDFKQKNVKGFSRSKEFTYGGAGTKYRYIMAEYKENGFYYPKGSKAKASPSMVRSTTLAQEKRSVRMAVLSVVS